MADRVSEYAAKSLAKFLQSNVSGVLSAYVVTPDFDYDKKPVVTSPDKRETRLLPFFAIHYVSEFNTPFSIGNILFNTDLELIVEVCSSDQLKLVQETSSMKQALRGATHPNTGEVGVQLFNFNVVSGSFYADGGCMQIWDIQSSVYIGPDDKTQFENRKFRSQTPITLSAFKDKTATLLENAGNIGISDTGI